ncbi:actin depolymerizing protein [Schizopora paradoxa]|uniref:Cofilin n=1 Tax=Schizopora paradoxa TaxID=27342 RepID=A0A0H2RW04_9AGAM|nr:actin depolymerizing protein [Schizopora paradoxa]
MSSGIQAKEACDKSFADLKAGKLKYIVFKLTDNYKEIDVGEALEVEKGATVDNEETFTTFVSKIKGESPQCRFAVFDFEYNAGEGLRKKIVFFFWAPDDAKVKDKMVYASSRDALRKKLEGVQVEVQCNDDSELDYNFVLDKCKKSSR